MNLLKEIKANQNLVLELERGSYKLGVLTVNKTLSSKFKPIAYITLTKPAKAIMETLEKEGVNLKNYHFIDCVSKRSGLEGSVEKTVFVAGPTSLTELGIAITKLIKEKKPGLLIFDSISSLLIYNDELKAVKFLHFLMTHIKGTNAKAVYLIMRSDLGKKVVRELELFADSIIWLE